MSDNRREALSSRIMVWRSTDTLSHVGTWSTTRYPAEAEEYISLEEFNRMRDAAQLGLDMARANDLWNTAEEISSALISETPKGETP
ncbi:hypothetical protein [uncultured Sulfitobacter sp.]|uniref:hypothetical protein n=1 Tax=uncultured Sulfitobacter sp. TaxID=191468 RepID=UPI0030D87E2C